MFCSIYLVLSIFKVGVDGDWCFVYFRSYFYIDFIVFVFVVSAAAAAAAAAVVVVVVVVVAVV